ncbi:MAG: MBOAT family protein [Cyanobacteria bacterium]|nr:MBOAT family protein [Cyanobacteriota bacterium]
MNFITPLFMAFLLALFIGFSVVPAKGRKPLLLLASYVFYGTWSIPFLALILITTNIDYWMSQVIHNSQKPLTRKLALTAALVINLGVLFYFKYSNFFLSNLHLGAQKWPALQALSNNLPASLDIILPLGISFFTFEAISYMVDVYRGQKPSPNWVDYNFYIMYFPHLISGPIIRFKELYSQYQQKEIALASPTRLAQGCELILLGFIFKICLADPISGWADPVFQDPTQASVTVSATYLAALAFTAQIYFDFLGYTHIARGVSLLFNLELPLNFNHPYLAHNISNFWERWHISLSRWIRDYLYFPLGGSRGNLLKTVLNLLVTMTICGAWHGSGWHYMVWGLYHGILLALYHLYKMIPQTLPGNLKEGFLRLKASPYYNFFSILTTFKVVVLGWVLFRGTSVSSAWVVWGKLFQWGTFWTEISQQWVSGDWITTSQILFLLVCCFSGPWVIQQLQHLYRPLPFWVKAQGISLLFLLYLLSYSDGTKPFIYFQF